MSSSTIQYNSLNGTPAIFTRDLYTSGSISNLTLGEGWTSISGETFRQILTLIAINIPSSLTSIGSSAFRDAVNLNSCIFNNSHDSSLNSIGANAFFNAIRLTQVTIPANVTNIGLSAFENASGLTSITIDTGSKFVNIDQRAFWGATSLTQINIPSTVTNIGQYAFGNTTSLTQIIVDGSNNNYSSDSYGVLFNKNKTILIQYPIGNPRQSYDIPTTVTSVAQNAFYGATALTSINIPASVTIIGVNAFAYMFNVSTFTVNASNQYYSSDTVGVLFNRNKTELIQYPSGNNSTTYTIPTTVLSILSNAFINSTKLTALSIDSTNNAFSTDVSGVLFNKYKNYLIHYPIGNTRTSYVIPTTVIYLEGVAFYGASYLTSITFPTGPLFTSSIDYSGMTSLSNITTVTKSGQSTRLTVSNGVLFDRNLTTLYKYPSNKSNTSYVIPATVRVIANGAFDNATNLTSLTFSNNNCIVGSNSFKNSALTTVIINESTNINNIDLYVGTNQPFYGKSNVNVSVNTKILLGSGELNKSNASVKGATKVIISGTNLGYAISGYNKIGLAAFKDVSSITEISIPNTITDIGIESFSNATNLKTVTFATDSYGVYPQLTGIQNYAFQGASNLTTINIPSSVIRIGQYAFQDASKLASITFPQNSELTTIEDYVFQGASILTTITIPASVTSIGTNAFAGSSITTVVFEESTLLDSLSIVPGSNKTLYGKSGITVSHITKVYDGSGSAISELINATNKLNGATKARVVRYSSIGQSAFNYATNLTHLTISPSIRSIGSSSFSNCTNLKNIIFEDSGSLGLFGINVGVVSYFNGASNVTISINTRLFLGINQLNYSNTSNFLANINKARIQAYSSIGLNAFLNATKLVSVTIPFSVTEIGQTAFYNCAGLKSVTFDSGSQLRTIGSQAFFNTLNMTSIIIPSSVISIGVNAFQYSGIKSVLFDSSISVSRLNLTAGQGQTFFGANNVYISYNTQDFNGSGELTNAASYFSGENPIAKYASIEGYNSIGANAFDFANKLQSVNISYTVTTIKDNAFKFTLALSEITIPSTISSIGQNAFKSSGIKKIIFTTPSLLTNIGANAFSMVQYLTQITIPESVTSIGPYAFQGATSLTSITVPKTITNIADYMFNGAIALPNFTIPDSVTGIGEYAFTDCSGLTQINIPTKVTYIGNGAFQRSGLTQLYIPSNVITISGEAFSGITSLTKVIIEPDSNIESIGENAFVGCSSLNTVSMSGFEVDRLKKIYPYRISLHSDGGRFTNFFGATNVTYINSKPTPTPICFPKGTPVTTNQGNIAIELLDPDVHTIRNKRIIAITHSQPLHTYIVSIEKDALGTNIPNARTQISKEHKVYYKGEMIKAKELVKVCKGVTKIPYTGETLYNVLMEKHDKMMINNLICETLHPENIMAKIHIGKYSNTEKSKLYKQLSELIESGDEPAYNKFYATLR